MPHSKPQKRETSLTLLSIVYIQQHIINSQITVAAVSLCLDLPPAACDNSDLIADLDGSKNRITHRMDC